MPQQTTLRVDGFERLTNTRQTINFDNFSIIFQDNNCTISYPDNHLFFNQYQLEWIFSMLEMFFQYPIIDSVIIVRNSYSITDFNTIIQNFLFFKSRYDSPAIRNTSEYNDKILPFLYSIEWYHKAHRVFDICPTLSFLSLLTAIDALNGDNERTVGIDFRDIIRRYNPSLTETQAQKLYKSYRCNIVHQGEQLRHDVFYRTLERDLDFVIDRTGTEIFTDEQGNIQTRHSQMNQDILGDITYNYLYKIVANCLVGYLSDYVTETRRLV